MNWRHGIHPNNYAIGETEKYYSDMSEKGWELVKCGITLSRFQKTEPKKMRYRVEVVNLKFPPPYFLQWRVKGCIYCIAFIHVLIG